PLGHAEGEAADFLPGDRFQPHHAENLVDATRVDVACHRDPRKMLPGGSGTVDRLRIEQRPNLMDWRREVPVGDPVDGDASAGGVVKAEDHSHRRGLSRAVRAKEAGDDARSYLE